MFFAFRLTFSPAPQQQRLIRVFKSSDLFARKIAASLLISTPFAKYSTMANLRKVYVVGVGMTKVNNIARIPSRPANLPFIS